MKKSKKGYGLIAIMGLTVLAAVYVVSYEFIKEREFPLKEIAAVEFDDSLFSSEGWKLEGRMGFGSGDSLNAKVRLEHFNSAGIDVVSDIIMEINMEESVISGDFRTEGLIIDYTPFEEIKGNFKISGDVIKVTDLSMGNEWSISGDLELVPPYNVNIECESNGMDIEKVVSLFGNGSITGRLFGRLSARGPFCNLRTKGILKAENGVFGGIKYYSAVIPFEGEGDIIRIAGGRIFMEEGFLPVDGYFDLKRIDRRGFWRRGGDDMGSERFAKREAGGLNKEMIVWQGWDIKGEGLNLGKDIGTDFRINFQAYGEEIDYREYMELEYKVGEAEFLKMRIEENEEYLSLEHKKRF